MQVFSPQAARLGIVGMHETQGIGNRFVEFRHPLRSLISK
jgi:hypothetical protein